MVTETKSKKTRGGNGTFELIAAVQNYEWGLQGSNSLVAKLWAVNTGEKVDESKPYAELWMGTHTSAPSQVKSQSGVVPLKDVLKEDLPFLFKVLSVGKALSIQAHPDKELAKELHAKDPKNYKDSNHKPEMTIALSNFEALSGFRPLEKIVGDLESVPELANLVSEEALQKMISSAKSKDEQGQKEALKLFFGQFIAAEKDLVVEQINKFESRMTTMNRKTTALEELCLRLNGQFPEEVGCFCVFLLNFITLAPGEAIFLAANEPHAYLSGDCIECMALSDNVVRAGLTPKFRDVETLVKMLTYKTFEPKQLAMAPTRLTDRPASMLYKPPVKEFQVIKIALKLGEQEKIISAESHSILLCVRGDLVLLDGGDDDVNERKLSTGTILMLKKGTECQVSCNSSEALLFQACSSQ